MVMKMKILASDFDNTLFFHVKGFNKGDLEAIKRFQSEGHKFGVCTGRSYEGILRPSKHIDIHYDFYILLSGTLILDEDGHTIFEKRIAGNTAKAIMKKYRVFTTIVYDDHMKCLFFHFKDTIKRLLKRPFHTSILLHPDDLKPETINAFSLHFTSSKQAYQCCQEINETYGDEVIAFQNRVHVDIAAKGCSKGEGLRIIENYYHASKEDIYGIGDSWNDMPLLTQAAHSFTFDYAPKELTADHIVDSLESAITIIEKT